LQAGHFDNWSFCQMVILSNGHFVKWSFCQLVILSTGHFVYWSFCQLVILCTHNIVNCLTYNNQPAIYSVRHFVNKMLLMNPRPFGKAYNDWPIEMAQNTWEAEIHTHAHTNTHTQTPFNTHTHTHTPYTQNKGLIIEIEVYT
jgi:hypothetical protein